MEVEEVLLGCLTIVFNFKKYCKLLTAIKPLCDGLFASVIQVDVGDRLLEPRNPL